MGVASGMDLIRATARHVRAMPRALAWERERAGRGRVHRITSARVDGELAGKLEEFERRFVIRLSAGAEINRLHGPDFNAYYRSIGRPAVTLVVEEEGRVVGTESLVLLRVRVPGGIPLRFVYALNVRVAPECRFGAVLERLQFAALCWGLPRCWGVLTVIPDVTSTPPRSRSGRFGIPTLRRLRRCWQIHVPLDRAADGRLANRCVVSEGRMREVYGRLTRGAIAPIGGRPSMRSLAPPVWLALHDGSACCCVEEFRRVRRYALVGGGELVWRCMSFFGAASEEAAAMMCRVACTHAARIGEEDVSVMVDDSLVGGLMERLELGGRPIPLSLWGTSVLRRVPDVPWVFNLVET